ncbi:MAG: hypothetical protein ACOY3P_13735 [Planctomycetota bacterium]
MNGKRMFRLLTLAWFGLLLSVSIATAAPPWANLLGAGVDADPERDYVVSEDNGPWMILACSFSGEGAEKEARDLALELRSRYKLEAYVHDMQFDYRDELRHIPSRGIGPNGRRMVPKHRRKSVIQEFAVMVGNYRAVDDPEAQRVVEKLKHAKPQCISDNGQTNQSLAGWRLAQQKVQEFLGSENKEKGPMGHAFITTNPLLGDEYFTPPGLDPLVAKMNKDVPYSLLTCPGRYTVVVAKFSGEDTLDQKRIAQLQDANLRRSKLEEGALKANTLVKALRMKGYEAYVLHDRYMSMVTVGSFNTVGSPRQDGRTEINPAIHLVMEQFKAKPVTIAGRPTGGMKREKMGPFQGLGDIYFDINPMPVEVPQQTISAALSSSMLGLR